MANTTNGTNAPAIACFSAAKVACYSLILVISLVGNILVILVVYKNKNMRKTINYFIVNMAASDLLTPLVVMPLQIARTLMLLQWAVPGKFGEALCKIAFFLTELPGPVSDLSLICMAFDRFVGVVFPLRVGLISSRVRVSMIIFTWAIPVGFAATSLYGFRLGQKGQKHYCYWRWHDDPSIHTQVHRNYFTVASSVFFIAPLVLLILLYSVILITLGKRKFPRVNQSQEAKKRNRRVSRSATVIALTIVLVFWICWCPYNTYMFLVAFQYNWKFPRECSKLLVFTISQTLTYANSAINPCIYFVLIENYRKGLRTVLPRTLSASFAGNSSLKVTRNVNRQDTQVNDDGDCLELVEQPTVNS
ncbi:octopamine receptor Oamb-like [Exaiptasia diaphana]|uniref:G-protein coupled receptors family 1 profile domain-containing protein n=1 Tax=Exaiptasia diaphana TaxID=2652724 RepID=A0A913YBU8_EXADI|nr:octopamine receptor Oamb-like [Exaiptasia diaphana]